MEAANTSDMQDSVAGPSHDEIISSISSNDDHVDAPDVADTMESDEAPNIESHEALDKCVNMIKMHCIKLFVKM